MSSEFGEKGALDLSLERLVQGFPHLSPIGAAMMSQAAVVCLAHHYHEPGTRLPVEGAFEAGCTLWWSEVVTDSTSRFWNDLGEATQHGAYAVAILLIRAITGYTIIERSKKGTGFDWWLGNDDNLFQSKARLEVSGILRGNAKRINSRLKARLQRTWQAEALPLPGFVVVVEFSNPMAKVLKQ